MRSWYLPCVMLVFVACGCASPVPKGTRALENIAYSDASSSDLLNLYIPASHHPVPLIVWIHGGAWNHGNDARNRSPAMRLLDRGFAVANVDYRLSGEARYPAQIHDCRAAVRFLRAHAAEYGIDPDHIGAWGESAGGQLAALLGTAADAGELDSADAGDPKVSCRVQAVCLWCAPTNLLEIVTGHDGKMRPSMDDPGSPVSDLLGGRVKDHWELARQASPVSFVTPGDPPFVMLHDERDPIVPYEQSEVLADALRKANVEAAIKPVPWGIHSGFAFDSGENQAYVREFFERTLKS